MAEQAIPLTYKGHPLRRKDSLIYYGSMAEKYIIMLQILSPQKIILGGGVMHQEQLMPMIRSQVKKLLNGYLDTKELQDLDSYIVLPSLNDNQGIMGAIKLAMEACE